MTKIVALAISLLLVSSAYADPKILKAFITGDGEGNVTVTTLQNTFTRDITFREISEGEYRIESCGGEFTEGFTTKFSELWPTFYAYLDYIDKYRVRIFEQDGFNGDPTHGNQVYVNIEVHPEP